MKKLGILLIAAALGLVAAPRLFAQTAPTPAPKMGGTPAPKTGGTAKTPEAAKPAATPKAAEVQTPAETPDAADDESPEAKPGEAKPAEGEAVEANPTEANPTEAKPAETPHHLDPAALAILKAASDKLAAAKTISFVARGAFDVPAADGQPLFYLTRSEVLLDRPNKLRVIIPGDGPPTEFYYDGSMISVFMPSSDLIATTEASGTLDEALDSIYKKAGVYLPFVDFIVADPYKTLTGRAISAFVIGQSKLVGDATTDIVSISDPHVHLQIWIGAEDKLPRLVWATAVEGPEKPRHMIEFSDWKLNARLRPASSAFAPHTKPSTKRIPFAHPERESSAAP